MNDGNVLYLIGMSSEFKEYYVRFAILKSRGEYFSEKPIFLYGPQKWPCTKIQEPLAPGQ
jgi:hypothetical protein